MLKKTKGFTIVELLTVMSIIIILMGVLVPALNRVRRYAKIVTQKGQFHEISKGLELFRNDHQENYPDSSAADACGVGYCGAMRLCEAMLGQDGMGFNPLSHFNADGVADACDLYPFNLCTSIDSSQYSGTNPSRPDLASSLQQRIKYVDAENIKTFRLQDMYTWAITSGISFYNYGSGPVAFSNTTRVDGVNPYHNAVIGDVFLKGDIKTAWCKVRAGQKVGMPVLYYKADTSKLIYDAITQPVSGGSNLNIYNFDDNHGITTLGCPWESSSATNPHPMGTDPTQFYKETVNSKITSTPRPHNEDGYILLSAGWDGLYGTKDDVFNFTE